MGNVRGRQECGGLLAGSRKGVRKKGDLTKGVSLGGKKLKQFKPGDPTEISPNRGRLRLL